MHSSDAPERAGTADPGSGKTHAQSSDYSGKPRLCARDPPPPPRDPRVCPQPVLERGRGTYQRVRGAEHWAAEQERQAGRDPGGPHRHRLGPCPSGQPPPPALVMLVGYTAASGWLPRSRPGLGDPGGPAARGPGAGRGAHALRASELARRREREG